MQSTFAFTVALFSATIIAAPILLILSTYITFLLTNNVIGHSA